MRSTRWARARKPSARWLCCTNNSRSHHAIDPDHHRARHPGAVRRACRRRGPRDRRLRFRHRRHGPRCAAGRGLLQVRQRDLEQDHADSRRQGALRGVRRAQRPLADPLARHYRGGGQIRRGGRRRRAEGRGVLRGVHGRGRDRRARADAVAAGDGAFRSGDDAHAAGADARHDAAGQYPDPGARFGAAGPQGTATLHRRLPAGRYRAARPRLLRRRHAEVHRDARQIPEPYRNDVPACRAKRARDAGEGGVRPRARHRPGAVDADRAARPGQVIPDARHRRADRRRAGLRLGGVHRRRGRWRRDAVQRFRTFRLHRLCQARG